MSAGSPACSPEGLPRFSRRRRGSALLMVLWLSAALAAIGFSLASTVRGEAERTATALDGVRSYYLAIGGILRCQVELLWSSQFPNDPTIKKGSTEVLYNFPSGVVRVEIIPEAGRLDINNVPVPELVRLLNALGEPPGKAEAIAGAIDSWRKPGDGGAPSGFSSSSLPSFQVPHASFQEIEELLLVPGVTPDLFYGTYVPTEAAEPAVAPDGSPAGRLSPRGGLMDCLTVYGSGGQVDANTAAPAVLAAIGMPPFAIQSLVARRRQAPLTQGELMEFAQSVGVDTSRLRVEGNKIATLRATARLRLPDGKLSDLRRTVAAQMRFQHPGSKMAIDVLRWYDTAWSN
jgi:general secretion pathway protein K